MPISAPPFVSAKVEPGAPQAAWASLIPEEQWAVFCLGVSALEKAGIPYLLHGALALATYTGHWRNTKDVDVIIGPELKEKAIGAMQAAGFEDYYDKEAYDRSWIFRGYKDGVLFDVIWELPNHRVQIDEQWFVRATPLILRGKTYAVVPCEELVRVKLYIMQRERCDWVDVLNVLASSVQEIDWTWLVARMDRDLPLLHAAVAIFNWMCPDRARSLPSGLRERFALPLIDAPDGAEMEVRRVRLFDSRPWFALHQPVNQPLER